MQDVGGPFGIYSEELAMAFGKPGRPPEDRLARQREIYEAVTPLIYRDGARRLSMRDAASAACLSIGGLYHYFPNKRDLVLHGLRDDARARICQGYRERIADLTAWSVEAYVELYLELCREMFGFVRPAVLAALELGVEEFQAQLAAGLTTNVAELAETLHQLAPDFPQSELERLGRGIRRIVLGTLVDRDADLREMQEQVRALIEGHLASALQPGLVAIA
jgi:AcrR family transcriptional regulator